MSVQVNTQNVGNIPNGSRNITLNRPSSDPVATLELLAESFDHNAPTTKIERRGTKNQPTGFVRNKDFNTGTATLQVINSGANELRARIGDWFEEDGIFWAVTDAPQGAEAQGADKKQSIQFEEIIDPAAYYVDIAGTLTLVTVS